MKKVSLFIIIIFTGLLSACGKHDCCDTAQKTSAMTAQKNGTLWSPLYAAGKFSKTDSLTIAAVSYTQGSIKIDSLNLKILYTNNTTYQLNDNQASYMVFNADAVSDIYKLDPSFNNQLTITGYQVLPNSSTSNPNEVKISGTFSLKFIDPKNPAGISFLNGNFFTITDQ